MLSHWTFRILCFEEILYSRHMVSRNEMWWPAQQCFEAVQVPFTLRDLVKGNNYHNRGSEIVERGRILYSRINHHQYC